jgi:uncharacterized membrane protein YccF (DUF307 family)
MSIEVVEQSHALAVENAILEIKLRNVMSEIENLLQEPLQVDALRPTNDISTVDSTQSVTNPIDHFLRLWKAQNVYLSHGSLLMISLLGLVSGVCFVTIAYLLASMISYVVVHLLFSQLPLKYFDGDSLQYALTVAYILVGLLVFHELAVQLYRFRDNWLLEPYSDSPLLYSILRKLSHEERIDLFSKIAKVDGTPHSIFLMVVCWCTSHISPHIACAVTIVGIALGKVL